MATSLNPKISQLLQKIDWINTRVWQNSYIYTPDILREQKEIENMIDGFLPTDHDELMQIFISTQHPDCLTKIVIAQALIRLGSSKIRSLIFESLHSADPFDVMNIASALFILGLGPYHNDKEVLDLLRNELGKENRNITFKNFVWFIPVLGEPLNEYSTHELASYSLINLGDFSKLEDILLAQLFCEFEKSKDKFIQWVYSTDKHATIQALKIIASKISQGKNWSKLDRFASSKKMASALGQIGEEDCLEPLRILYDQDNFDIKIAILEALEKIDGEGALAIISKATENKNFFIKQKAKRILKNKLNA